MLFEHQVPARQFAKTKIDPYATSTTEPGHTLEEKQARHETNVSVV